MKACRSQSVSRKGRAHDSRSTTISAATQGADLFDALDMFLTGLILDRAPVDARTDLTSLLVEGDGKAVRSRGRKKAFASAS